MHNCSLNDDRSLKVVIRGYNKKEKRWQEAIGKAKFVKGQKIGYLKVSFFGLFYGTYLIFFLETDYSVALVSGYNLDYFWLLSRSPTMSSEKLSKYIALAKKAGFATNLLV